MGLLYLNQNISDNNNSENKFWLYFSSSLNANPKRIDRKQRILSIIAKEFSYNELNDKLKVYIKIVLTFLLFVIKLILSIYYLSKYHQN